MILKLRSADEEAAEVLLRPLRAEPGIPSELVDFLVTRVAGGMLWARLEGRRDREFEIAYEQGQARAWAGRLRTKTDLAEAQKRLAAFVGDLRAAGIDVWGWDDGSIVLHDGHDQTFVEHAEEPARSQL